MLVLSVSLRRSFPAAETISSRQSILPSSRPDGLFQEGIFPGPVGASSPALCPPARCIPVEHARKQAARQSNHHHHDRGGEHGLGGHQEDDAEHNGRQGARRCPQDRVMGTRIQRIRDWGSWREPLRLTLNVSTRKKA